MSGVKKEFSGGMGCFPLLALASIVFVFFALSGGCGTMADESGAKKHLETSGFQQVKPTGTSYFASLQGCGDQDVVLHKFSALNPRNQRVEIAVCQGWPIKGFTIRGQ